jgi:PAS domain S-box-containing protein
MQPRARLYAVVPLAATVIVLLALGLGIFLFQHLKDRYISTAGDNLAFVAAQMADKLDLMLVDRYGDIQVLARSLQPLDVADIADSLYAVQSAYPLYSWIAVTDEKGQIVAATDRASIGQTLGDTASFQTIRKRGGMYLEDLTASRGNSEATVALSARVLSSKGDFRGIVTTWIRLHSLAEVLERTAHAYETSVASGKVEYQIVAKNGKPIFESAPSSKGHAKVLAIPSVLLSETGQSGYVEEQSVTRHASVITGYAHTRSHDELPSLQWNVLVRVDRSDVLAPLSTLAWKLALLVTIVLPLLYFLLTTTVQLRRDWIKTNERNDWLFALLRSIGQAVIAVDLNEGVTFMNSLAESLTGWKQAEAKGRRLKEVFALVDESTRQPLQDPIGRVLHEGRAITLGGRALLIAKDGTEKAILQVGAPIRTPDGNILGIGLVFREVRSSRPAPEAAREERFKDLLDESQEVVHPTQSQT